MQGNGSRVPENSERSMTVLERITSNLPDRLTYRLVFPFLFYLGTVRRELLHYELSGNENGRRGEYVDKRETVREGLKEWHNELLKHLHQICYCYY
jgi:hypothetical protein